MSVKRQLFLMAFSACLPIALFAMYLGISDVRAVHRATNEHARVIVTNVRQTLDRELEATISGLKVLAASRNLGDGAPANGMKEFYAEAVDFVRNHGANLLLLDQDGSQVFNTRKPLGTSLPKTNAPEALAQVFATGQAVVTDVFIGAVLQEPLVGVEVPVIRAGRVLRVLCLNLLTDDIQRLVVQSPGRKSGGWRSLTPKPGSWPGAGGPLRARPRVNLCPRPSPPAPRDRWTR